MSSKRGSAGESRMPSPQRNPTRSASSGGLAAPPSSPLPPQAAASTSAAASAAPFLERARSPFALPPPEEDCFGYYNAERREVKGERKKKGKGPGKKTSGPRGDFPSLHRRPDLASPDLRTLGQEKQTPPISAAQKFTASCGPNRIGAKEKRSAGAAMQREEGQRSSRCRRRRMI